MEEPTYSRMQYFFWLISGSEISTLRHCPEDYNRHANVGMMILITALFAASSALIAGKTFTGNNNIGVIAFALLWGVLIMSLDRSMVNSIKRDPKVASQPFWPLFTPRLILAVILAFFMSIPVDHLVFSEAIERQLELNNHHEWVKRQAELTATYRVGDQERDLENLSAEIKQMDSTLHTQCPDPGYNYAMSNYNFTLSQIPNLQADLVNQINRRSGYYRQLQRQQGTVSPITDEIWQKLRNNSIAASRALNQTKNDARVYKHTADSIYSLWYGNLQSLRGHRDSIRVIAGNELRNNKDSININAAGFRKQLQSMQGFDTKFMTLFLIPNWGVQILKWSIFLALLVIEILPTYLKLRTPVGEYDIEINKKEQAFVSRARYFIIAEEEIASKSEKYREEKEVELNNKIVEKIAAIELKLADESLLEWEKDALVKIRT